jgi:adenylate cyclase 10
MVGNRIRNQTVKTQSLEHLTIIEKMRDPLLYQESKQELFHIDLSTLLYNFLYLKSGGHPLILINLVNNLMERNFIYVDEDKGIAFVSEQFKAIIEHEEWLRVDVPLTSLQVAGPIIDRMSCLNQLLLKLASVIGEIFDLQTLYRIVPFKDQVNLKTLTKIIKELDNQDVIEFMDGDSENEHYRYSYCRHVDSNIPSSGRSCTNE